MNIRRTVRLLLILAAAFGALLVAVVLWRPDPPDDYESLPTLGEEHGIVFADITRAVVEYADPTMPDITIERAADGWRLRDPVDAPALESGAEDILRVLERNIRERIGAAREEYGLGTPQVALTVEFGGRTKRFLFGRKGVSYSLYVKEESESDAILMEAWVLDEVMRTPAELRDRSVMTFEKRDARQVSVTRDGGGDEIAAAREAADAPWRLTAPLAASADQEAITATLDALLDAKAAVFAADGVSDLLSYDLGPGATDVRVTLIEGGSRTIRVGGEPFGEDGRIRVASVDNGSVYEVNPDLLDALPRRALEWRDRRVADFQRSETHRVEVSYGSVRYALEKRATLAETAWHIVEPREARADSSRIDELLFELDSVEADDILEGPAAASHKVELAHPRLTVTLYDQPGRDQPTVVSFGRSDGGMTTIQVNDGASVAMAPDVTGIGWLRGVAGLRERALPDLEPIDVRRIEVRRDTGLLAFTRQGVVWRISEPVVEQADNAIVDGILLALDQMSVDGFASGSERDLGEPAATVTLVSKNLERVTYSFWPRDGSVVGRVGGDPDTFTITAEQYAEVGRTLADARVTPTPER